MPSHPPIAVCIGCYNQAQYLEGAIQSALAQTYPHLEIWVSDDASTDGTGELIEQLRPKYPMVRFSRQERNLGVAGNNSWLLSQPRTEIAVRLDSDDRLEPDFIQVLSDLMHKHPKAGFAHCHAYELDSEDRKPRVRRIRPRPEYEDPEESLRNNASGMRVAANNIMYRTAAAREAGFFTAGMGFSEDWDLLVKIADRGWGNVYTPGILSNYRVWTDARGVRAKRKMAEVQTTIHVYEKTLAPAYERRGWSTDILWRHRRRKAIGFTDAIDSPLFSPAEREEYKRLLIQLGDSSSLRLHLLAAGLGGAPLIRAQRRYAQTLKDSIKTLIDAKREQRASVHHG